MEISHDLVVTLRGLSDVIREIAAEQRYRGFLGRTVDEVQADKEQQAAEDLLRDQDLDTARHNPLELRKERIDFPDNQER